MAGAQSIRAAKKLLRKELKQRIASLSANQKQLESLEVTKRLLAMPEYQDSKRICIYLHMDDEIRTTDILKDIFFTRKICYIPHYDGPNMNMVRLQSMQDYDKLPMTSWNIKQPANDEQREDAIDNGGLDLIIVPGLGFTKEGHRLGRGKGYYDGYLQKYAVKYKHQPSTIALAFSVQICDEIPTSDHDRTIDKVVYPNNNQRAFCS